MIDSLFVFEILAILAAGILLIAIAAAIVVVRKRNLHLWLGSYCFGSRSRTAPSIRNAESDARGSSDRPIDVFIAVCDHFEPEWGSAGKQVALNRVHRWCNEYPRLFSQFQDSRGCVPQHTFFFPQDQYAPEYLDLLAELCSAGFGDVDVHLHHDNDTAEALRERLDGFRETLHDRHGLLRRDPISGEIVYGFIHGNWALCNSRPDGRWCGVDNEITVLRETGCYADFTMPSAPTDTQTRTINSIYYALDQPGRRKSHDTGIPAQVGAAPAADGLLMIQGPLMLDWHCRKWGMLPRIENADLHAGRAPTWRRFKLWMQANIHVAGHSDWLFVKLHTHGCKDGNIDMLLGNEMQQFHVELARQAEAGSRFRYYYVTAWQMAELVHQAENGTARPDFNDGDAVTTPILEGSSLGSALNLSAAGR